MFCIAVHGVGKNRVLPRNIQDVVNVNQPNIVQKIVKLNIGKMDTKRIVPFK
jgi:hypothetical protein